MKLFVGDKEKRLVRRLRNGETAAIQDLYSLYADYLMGVCARYIADEEDLKDVFQDFFLRILTHIDAFAYRGAGSLQAWLTKIAVNEALKFLKMKHRHLFVRLDREPADEPEADDPPIDDLPPEVLHRLVSELPTGYRTVFNLYVFENKSHQEIAALLGIRTDTSASQLHRAKNRLVEKIAHYRSSQHPTR